MFPIGLAAGLIPQIVGMFTAGKQRREARRANAQAQQMFNQSVGYANQGLNTAQNGLAQAQNDYNSRMPGASYLERNIYQNQANTMGAVNRNATDSSQALAMAGAVQGNTNNAFNQLAQQEAQNKLYQQFNLANARQGVMGEQNNLQNVYGRQSEIAANSAAQLGQAAQQNSFNALQGLGNIGMMAGLGQFGNLGSLFGGQSGGMMQSMPSFQPGVLDNQISQLHNMYRIPITNAGRIQ